MQLPNYLSCQGLVLYCTLHCIVHCNTQIIAITCDNFEPSEEQESNTRFDAQSHVWYVTIPSVLGKNPMIVRTERKLVIVIAPLEEGHATSRSPKQRRSGREDRTRVERGRIVPARVVRFAASSSRSASASREVPWRRVLD